MVLRLHLEFLICWLQLSQAIIIQSHFEIRTFRQIFLEGHYIISRTPHRHKMIIILFVH